MPPSCHTAPVRCLRCGRMMPCIHGPTSHLHILIVLMIVTHVMCRKRRELERTLLIGPASTPLAGSSHRHRQSSPSSPSAPAELSHRRPPPLPTTSASGRGGAGGPRQLPGGESGGLPIPDRVFVACAWRPQPGSVSPPARLGAHAREEGHPAPRISTDPSGSGGGGGCCCCCCCCCVRVRVKIMGLIIIGTD
jgi:hypothetical protein